MAKAMVCIGSTQVNMGTASINYSVSLIGPPNLSYSADYLVNTSITVTANLLAWRNTVISYAASKGITLLVADVIVFGAPS